MINLSSLLLLLAVTSPSDSKKSLPYTRPNVLFIFPDQWRGSAIGEREKEPVKTPYLDRLANSGLDFQSCGSSYPVCSPFRAMLMSGQYSWNNGVVGNCQSNTAAHNIELKQNAICWSDVLAKNGYSLGYIGKWHLDAPQRPYINCSNNRGKIAWNEWCPPERRHGFSYWHAYGTYDDHLNPMYWTTHAKRDEFHFVNQYGPQYEVDRAIEFIENKDGTFRDENNPWALVISMNPPHTDYSSVPRKYKEIYKDLDIEKLCQRFPNLPAKDTNAGRYFRENIKNYYAQCSAIDEQFGRLYSYLVKENLLENTLIIFTSDHGDCMGLNGIIGKNAPMETCMSVPCFITWKNKISSRKDTRCFVSPPDFAPTILGLIGLEKQIPKEWDGYNLANYILQEPTAFYPDGQLYIYMTNGYNPKETKEDYYQYGRRGWRNKEWIYSCEIFPNGTKETLLYHLKSDPFQLHNVATNYPKIVDQLHQRTLKALKEFGDDQWKGL